MAGLDPAIHVLALQQTWMRGTRPGVTLIRLLRMPYDLIVIGGYFFLPLKGGAMPSEARQGGGPSTDVADPHPARRHSGSPTSPLQGEE